MGSETDEVFLTGGVAKDRAAPILRRHKQAKLAKLGLGLWNTWSPGDMSFLMVVYCFFPLVGIELALWLEDWPDNLFGLRVSGSVASLVLLLTVGNGWLIDRFLASMTPGESALPKRLRCLRLLIAIVPVFGLYAFTFWKGAMEGLQLKHGPLAPRNKSRALDLLTSPGRLAAGALLQRFYRSNTFFFGILLGIFPLVLWAGWLMSTPFGSHRRAVILGSCTLLHLTACTLMMHSFSCRLRNYHVTDRQRILYRAVPFLWLLATPGLIAGLILSFILVDPRETLVWKLHSRRTGTGRMPLWQSLQGSLRRQWQDLPWFVQWRQPAGLTSETREGHADQQVTAFYRLKTFLLILEGAAFFASLSILAAQFPQRTGTLNRIVQFATFGAIALAGIGLLIQTTMLVARVLRIPGFSNHLASHPYGRYLLLTQGAFLAGLGGAALVAGGQIVQFGILLFLGGVLCAALSIPFFLPGARLGDLLLWLSLFVSLSALGVLIGIEGRGSLQSLEVLGWLTALSPLWSLGLFLALGGWLLRPFSWRHAFDRRFPGRFRTVLAFMISSAALPLGGLAIPFWIYVRLRLWPRYEPLLSSPDR